MTDRLQKRLYIRKARRQGAPGFFCYFGLYIGRKMHTVCGGASERKTCTSALRGLLLFALSPRWGDDPFLGGFFFSFFRPPRWGRSLKAAPGPGFSLDFSGGGPAFLLCGNLLSLDRENDCARPFIFPGWSLQSGSRSDRAGPGLGRGVGMYDP